MTNTPENAIFFARNHLWGQAATLVTIDGKPMITGLQEWISYGEETTLQVATIPATIRAVENFMGY